MKILDDFKDQLRQACDLNDKEKEKRKKAESDLKETVVALDATSAENEKISAEVTAKTQQLHALREKAEQDQEKIAQQLAQIEVSHVNKTLR